MDTATFHSFLASKSVGQLILCISEASMDKMLSYKIVKCMVGWLDLTFFAGPRSRQKTKLRSKQPAERQGERERKLELVGGEGKGKIIKAKQKKRNGVEGAGNELTTIDYTIVLIAVVAARLTAAIEQQQIDIFFDLFHPLTGSNSRKKRDGAIETEKKMTVQKKKGNRKGRG